MATEEVNVMRIGKRCFVGNLAWRTSWQDLKDHFRESGTVVYANVMRDDNGRSKGWGIVEFESPEQAVDAVNALNGSELGDRKILVREDREDRDVKEYNRENGVDRDYVRRPRPNRGGRADRAAVRPAPAKESGQESSGLQVVVQGIPWKYTWKDLKPIFEDCGKIVRCDVIIGKDGRSRGYGTIRFEDEAGAQSAIKKYHGTELEGRTLTVKVDQFA